MSDAVLYINSKGQPVTHSSYSARQTFKKCPRQFELERVQGWSDKARRAAPLFGKCVEAGVERFEADGRKPGTALTEFVRLWADVQFLPEFEMLEYTDTEGNWKQLDRAGREMMRLYEIRAPFLPISINPKALFQQVLRKKLFPGTQYDKLENKAIVDILSFPAWDHSMLSPIDPPNGPTFHGGPPTRSLILDMKTSGVDLDTQLIMLDPQLAEYAWQARIPDIGFLWFVKKGHELERGSRITLLADCDKWHAGYEVLVLRHSEVRVEIAPAEGKKKAKYDDIKDGYVFVAEFPTLMEYKKTLHNLRGKERDAADDIFLKENAALIARVPETDLTKQRLQFGAARLTEQDMDEIGRDVAQTTVEMVRAHQEAYYPKLAGIRFPNQKCNFCSMRWICLNRPKERDENLSRKGEEWLDGNYEE